MNKLETLLREKPFLKIIAGIENFDHKSIQTVAQAADGLVASIDLSVDEAMIRWVKENTQLTVFVSSLSPNALAEAVEWGADLVELGNFQPLYDRGSLVSAEHVITWTRELNQLIQGRVPLCITLPGMLSTAEQVNLAQELQAMGADILQIENINDNLEHVAQIRAAVEIPVMLSGKLTPENLASAAATGVDSLGIGQYIRGGQTLEGMRERIHVLQSQLLTQKV